MIKITPHISLDEAELKYTFIRAPGPGGQNVNKVATGVQLKFNVIHNSSMPSEVRTRLIKILGNKITIAGYYLIKATRFRTQNRNKEDAFARLQAVIQQAEIQPKKRKKTKPTFASKQKRLEKKKQHSKNKSLRRKNPDS